jgi:hypothetical protein
MPQRRAAQHSVKTAVTFRKALLQPADVPR